MVVRAALCAAESMKPDLQLGFLTRGRVRLVQQTEATECGLAALAMIASFHGLDLDLAALRRRFSPSLRGTGLNAVIQMADQLGFASRAVKVPLESLSRLQLPAILHWNLNHYVVLERVSGRKALVHDSAGFSKWYRLQELSDYFTGVALELAPTNDFEPADQRERFRLGQLWGRITGLKRALVQTIVLSLVMQAFALTSPYYMQIAIDSAIPALDGDLLAILALGFGLFTVINGGASLLRSFVLLSAGTSLSYSVASNIARRLFRLPVAWFEKRHVGDVLSRFQSITPIQLALTQGAVAAMLDGALAAFLLLMMLFYSVPLAMLALVAFGLYGLGRAVSFSFQRVAQENAIVARAREQSLLMENIRGIVTLRLFNREAARHVQWQNRMTNALNAEVSVARIGVWQQATNTFIFGFETIVSIWLAASLAMAGGFSVGMIFAYMAYKVMFLTRGASLIDQIVAFRMLGLHLDRLSDIALADQDVSFAQAAPPKALLKGKLELRGLRFRYSPVDPLVLDEINLVVEPGEHVAITGPSGGGKTTLVKLILGLLEPNDGDILIDGVPLAQFGYKNYHDQIAAVLQDDSLFAGSLAHNIALFDDPQDMGRIIKAAQAAAIHDEIMQMPMAYETMVGDMGSSLSGGQKQRVLLARALYRQPRLLVMDEGTAHLDVVKERAVNEAISAMGITRIVVAHRLETISAADRVLTSSGGKLRERANEDVGGADRKEFVDRKGNNS